MTNNHSDKIMKLIPTIASYNGGIRQKCVEYLTPEVLELIYTIALRQYTYSQEDDRILQELELMHVIKRQEKRVHLDTAVFLEDDQKYIKNKLEEYVIEMVEGIVDASQKLTHASSYKKNFIGGILGIQQGLGKLLKEKGLIIDWQNYSGKYAQTKVDFNEDCKTYHDFGLDMQNKSVIQGNKYTAVIIGYDQSIYKKLVSTENLSPSTLMYMKEEGAEIIDLYPMQLQGKVYSKEIGKRIDEWLICHDIVPKDLLITGEDIHKYLSEMTRITEVVYGFWDRKTEEIRSILAITTSGKQGVSAENMMMNFWRFIRRLYSNRLYTLNYLTDPVPQNGAIVIFYENQCKIIKELLI